MIEASQGSAPAPPAGIALWALRLGALYVAAMALWRILLYVTALTRGLLLPVREAALTFMWIPDLVFLAVFLGLALFARRLARRAWVETALIAAGLQIAFLAATFVVFRRWTDAAALGFGDPLTWLHVLLPAAWCAWLFLFAGRRLWRLQRAQRRGSSASDCAASAAAESSEKCGPA